MSRIRSVFSVCLGVALAAGAFSSIASAQSPQKVTLGDIRILPTTLDLFPTIYGLEFQARNGLLMLTQPPMISSRKDETPTGPILWSKPLDSLPETFTLTAERYEETLKDSDGKVLWSQHFDKPSLTLIFDRSDHATLSDEGGKTLWSGSLPSSPQGFYKASSDPRLPGSGLSATNLYRYIYNKNQIMLENADGQMLWSGKPSKNIGLQIGTDASGQRPDVSGISAPSLPSGTTLHMTLTSEEDPLMVSKAVLTASGEQHLDIGTVIVPTLKLHITSDDKRYADWKTAIRHGVDLPYSDSPHTPEVRFSPRPATYYVTYRGKQGQFMRGVKYSVERLTPQQVVQVMPGQGLTLAQRYTIYRTLAVSVDENGRKTGWPFPNNYVYIDKSTGKPLN